MSDVSASRAARAPRRYAPTSAREWWKTTPILLYIFAIPLVLAALIAAVRGWLFVALFDAAAAAALAASAGAIAAGLRRERAAAREPAARTRTRRRARGGPPWKLIGALGAGAASFAAMWIGADGTLAQAVGVGMFAVAGSLMTYGVDPAELLPWTPQARAAANAPPAWALEALEDAYDRVDRIDATVRNLSCPELRERLGRITVEARNLLGAIENDPRDIRNARRFLIVYLQSVEDLSHSFIDAGVDSRDAKLDARYRNVLEQIEAAFRDQRERVARNDALDLDVKIEVLSEQLAREGFDVPAARAASARKS